MKKIFALILTVFLALGLTLPVFATDAEPDAETESAAEETDVLADLSVYYDFEHRSLEEILEQFRTEYGLSANNFAMAYYAVGTGESYGFQVDSYRDAAATYMLPLNIVFYDLEAADAINGKKDAEGEYYVDTYYLPYIYQYTITDDDASMAKTMKDYLGSYREYRDVLTQFSQQEYTEEYYTENVLNIRYMMNVLWYIYENRETYSELNDWMSKAYPGRGFDMLLEDRYNVAHKFSEEDDVCNDVAIIDTPQPFLLAAYSQNVGHAEEMLGALAELMTEYTLYLDERQSQGLPPYIPLVETEEIGETEAAVSAAVTDLEVAAAEEKEDGPVPVWLFVLVLILAIVCVVVAYMYGMVRGARMERRRIQAARKKKQTMKR